MICEETPGTAPGAIKNRRVQDVSTPANPMILASALERGGSEEEYYTEGMPLVGRSSLVNQEQCYAETASSEAEALLHLPSPCC